MEESKVEERLVEALGYLEQEHGELLLWSTPERTLVALVACYLRDRFPSHSVDSEYNRWGGNGESKRYGSAEGKREGGTFTPDLIVHGRGHDERNLLAAEFKLVKLSSIREKEKDKDVGKLKDLIEHKKYCDSAFVAIEVGDNRKHLGGYEICWGRGSSEGVQGFEACTGEKK